MATTKKIVTGTKSILEALVEEEERKNKQINLSNKNLTPKFTDYSDQYKHPQWQKKRLTILERDKYTCQVCDNTEQQLHVHHRFYIKGRKVWEYDNDVFQTLCENCHEKQHKSGVKQKEYPAVINELIELILHNFDNTEIDSILFILEQIKENKNEFPEYINYISNVFNSAYVNKVYYDLQILSELEDLSMGLSILKSTVNRKADDPQKMKEFYENSPFK